MSERLRRIREQNTRMMRGPTPAPLRLDIDYLLRIVALQEQQIEAQILARLDPDTPAPTTRRRKVWPWRKG